MMSSWLVLDLRDGQCGVGVLTVGLDGPDWYDELVLSVYKTHDIQDSTAQADLTFFRKPRDRTWWPIERTFLSRLPDGYDRIPSLLSEPVGNLHDLLPLTLYPLLRNTSPRLPS